MIIITDIHWKIEYVNHRFAEFRGISHDAALDVMLRDLCKYISRL